MSSVINIDGEAFFLGVSPQILLTDYGPAALLDYEGGLECLYHVTYSRTATLEAHLLPEWGWQACCHTSRDEAHAFWGSHHVWTLDLSKYLQERNMTHWNSVVFFKTCVVVYNLGDSVCVHVPKLWRSQFVSSTSEAYVASISWVPRSPRTCMHFPIPVLPGLTQVPVLHTWIHQYPLTHMHLESISYIPLHMCHKAPVLSTALVYPVFFECLLFVGHWVKCF